MDRPPGELHGRHSGIWNYKVRRLRDFDGNGADDVFWYAPGTAQDYLWMFAALSIVPAVLFWNRTLILALFCLLFVVTYVTAYLMIVRFKVPRWIRP